MSIDHQELWLIEQRDEAERKLAMAKEQIEYLRQREDALLKAMVQVSMAVNPPQPPKMLAHAESYEAGKAMAFNDAKYTVGIDTSDGVHTVTVFRMVPGQPTTLVASERLSDGTREQCAQLVETMGMQGYGALAMAAAIRKGQA